ncbi:MAG: COX15/CtaA family protein [bacterium]
MKLHVYTKFMVGATLVLIVAGGLVTSTGSGLAVPDWPLSYGMLFPPMIGGILYEHGHRMIAGAVAILTAVLALWLRLREPRRWVRRLGALALLAVILQAVLGGMTVIFLLPDAISIAHACLAQTFFCIIVAIAVVTSPRWNDPLVATDAGGAKPPLRTLAFLTFAAIFIQLLLGAFVRHMDAALAIPDFPLAFGQLIPPLHARTVAVAFAHRVWALVVLALIVWASARTGRAHRDNKPVLRPSMMLATLVLVQILLGASIVWTGRSVPVATAHVAVGAVLLGTSLLFAIRAARVHGLPCEARDAAVANDARSAAGEPTGARA